MANPPDAATLAERLEKLFAERKHPANRPYSNREVAAAITERGVKISHTHIWGLRTGQSANPPLLTLQALADFFGVPPSYFFDGDSGAGADPELADALRVAMQDAGVRQVALRASGLDDSALKAVLGVLDQIRQAGDRPR